MFKPLRTMLLLRSADNRFVRQGSDQESTSTLDNPQTAFSGESNANARYLAFAKKTGEEGFGEVAGLFRAAAKSEEIHARNYSGVIRRMGGNAGPESRTDRGEVNSREP